jgi:hypothetical protein
VRPGVAYRGFGWKLATATATVGTGDQGAAANETLTGRSITMRLLGER